MEKLALHMFAYGRVQGVGFRFFVRSQASAYGIQGWVRNRPDGSVEVHAEADKAMLKAFADRVKSGPTFGRVDELTQEWREASNDYSSFSIDF